MSNHITSAGIIYFEYSCFHGKFTVTAQWQILRLTEAVLSVLPPAFAWNDIQYISSEFQDDFDTPSPSSHPPPVIQ